MLWPILGLLYCYLLVGQSAWGQQEPLPYDQTFGGDFALQSSLGRTLSLQELRGKVVVLTFGYTSCPDICPITLGQLGSVYKGLGDSASEVQVLFVSFDPSRDSSEQLKHYMDFFDSSFIGLTGTDEQVEKVADQYGVFYLRRDIGSAAGYTFNHTSYVYLIDQAGKLRTFYDLNEGSQGLITGVKSLLQVGAAQ
ncbi:MAG: SCO family protein [Motiliproteus sp.]|nr:SCO family protein [Motiliproteus sp.]MCW9051855.1 SCO family protein [Motiliproteus sp.]